MAEEQELKLTVTLDDQASAQLGQLLQTMQGLGQSGGGGGAAGMNQFANSLRGAGSHAQGLQGSLMGMAAKGGFIGGVFAQLGIEAANMAKELANAVLNVREYADAMVSLEQAANRAATTAAQFQRNVAVMRESGISAEDARKNIQGYADALGDLQMEQSRVRQNLLAGLRGAEFEDMRSLIARVQGGDKQAALAEIKKFGTDIRAYWTSQGQAERGASAERAFYAQWGVPDLDKMRDDLETVSPQLETMYKRRMENAERFQTAMGKTADATDRGIRSIQATAFYALPLAETMEGISIVVEQITHWLETWESLVNNTDRGQGDAPPGQGQNPEPPPANFNERFNGAPGTPVPAGPKTWRVPIQLPSRLMGDGGAQQNALGGGGDEDRRASIVTNTDQVKSVTEELKRLNDYFELQAFKGGKVGLLGMPSGGRAGIPGGIAPGTSSGPTRSTPGSTDPDTGTVNPPAPVAPAAPAIPGPYGQPMPPWGTTETGPESFGGGTGGGVAGNVPGLAGGPSGPALTKEQRAAQAQPGGPNGPGGTPTVPGGGGPGGDAGQAAFIAKHRAAIMEELKDPAKRERFLGLVQAEVGSDPVAQKAFMETTIDRWAARGQTVARGTASSYYGSNPRYRTPSAATLEQAPGIIDQVTQGSASFPGATGNASAGVKAGHARKGRLAGEAGKEREGFVYEENAADRRYRAGVTAARTGTPAIPPVRTASADPNAPGGSPKGPTVNVDGKQIPAAIEAGARQAALGGSRALREYYRRNNIHLDDAWCGNHAATIMKSRGYQVPQNPQLASNWNRVTELGWTEVSEPQAGDIAVARPGWQGGRRGSGRTGETGSHVTTVESGVDKSGQFKTFGGNQGDPYNKYNARQFRFYRPPPPKPGQQNPPAAQTAQQQPPPGGQPAQPQSLVPSFMRGRDAARAARVGDDGTPPAQANAPDVSGLPTADENIAAVMRKRGAPPGSKPTIDDLRAASAMPSRESAARDAKISGGKTPDITPIDRAATKKVAVSGKGKVDVSVKTEPKGSAGKKNLTKDVVIPRKSQMTPAPTGPDHDASLDS